MHAMNMYDEMVLYIEACESGSMFDGLLADNINVYATTAANPNESSWGYYCYPDDIVNGVHINSCLGDLYSVKWMEDSDAASIATETLGDQFTYIKQVTASQQHAMEYGQLSFKTEPIGDFEGDLDITSNFFDNLVAKAVLATDSFRKLKSDSHAHAAVNSRDVRLNHLYAKVM